MEISIVTTAYKSERFLNSFITECVAVLYDLEIENYEIIVVIDGLTDNALDVLKGLKKELPQLKIVELSRNFGHHNALYAGLSLSLGEKVFIIDSDLEIRPKVLTKFYHVLEQDPLLDVVYGVQEFRKGNFIERVAGRLFWRLFNSLTDSSLLANSLTERLMRRNYVDALLRLDEKNIFLAGMFDWVGFNQKAVYLKKTQRSGKSTYSLRKRFSLMITAITSFSERPLIYILRLGLVLSFGSSVLAIYFILRKIFFIDYVLHGFTALIVVVLLSSGIILFSLGIASLYIGRIFKQAQSRPLFVIKDIH